MQSPHAKLVVCAALLVGAAVAAVPLPSLAGPPARRADRHAAPSRHSSSHMPPASHAIPAPDPYPFTQSAPAPIAPSPTVVVDGKTRVCKEQRAQDFLIRGNWFKDGMAGHGRDLFAQSLRFRTQHYGYFPGFGRPEWNAHAPRDLAVSTRFLGFTIQVNKSIVPALQCVEAALNQTPAHLDYRPHGVGGIRFHNTYYGGEVSNHVYGIAIDIDSDTNTCCGCVGDWSHHPACQHRVSSIYERMSMPHSWVETFERYGFYWLGHDVLQDTMHFEFLGDPDQILAP